MTPAELDDLRQSIIMLGDSFPANSVKRRTCVEAADALDALRADLAAKDAALQEVIAINHNIATKRQTAAEVDAAALRELMNCYNLGGWTDSERLIKERDALRALLQKALYAWTGDGPAIVLDELRSAIADTARALGEGQ